MFSKDLSLSILQLCSSRDLSYEKAALSADLDAIQCARTVNWFSTGNTCTSATAAGRSSIGRIIPMQSLSFPAGHEAQWKILFLKVGKKIILCRVYFSWLLPFCTLSACPILHPISPWNCPICSITPCATICTWSWTDKLFPITAKKSWNRKASGLFLHLLD